MLSKKEKKVKAVVQELTDKVESYAEKAETISSLTCIIKSNCLRKTANTKQQEIVDIGTKIQKKQRGIV